MGKDILIGTVTALVCMMIQCFIISLMLRILFRLEQKQMVRPTVICTTMILGVALTVLLFGNLVQVGLWGALFVFLGEFETYSIAFYHSIVNFATLGYGDIVMSEKYRLLGGIEAATGVLMFGLTTGFLYSVLTNIMQRAWNKQHNNVKIQK